MDQYLLRPDAKMRQEVLAQVSAHVPFGKQNAIPLDVLARATGYSTRLVRRAVELLNETGQIVIARAEKKGYFVPATVEELDAYISYNKSYWDNFTRKMRGMREYRGEVFGSEY